SGVVHERHRGRLRGAAWIPKMAPSRLAARTAASLIGLPSRIQPALVTSISPVTLVADMTSLPLHPLLDAAGYVTSISAVKSAAQPRTNFPELRPRPLSVHCGHSQPSACRTASPSLP